MSISQFRFPVDIRFGAGARIMLGEFAERFTVRKPLLITDGGLVKTEAFSLIIQTMEKIWPDSFERFTDVELNPTDSNIDYAFEAYRKANCDGVVGVGGGSSIDAAKAMRLKVAFPDEDILNMPYNKMPARLTAFCAIPTTAGTGSEVGQSSVLTIKSLGRKAIIGSPLLKADLAILDPELTISLPSNLTAWTGMDAMVHAIEAFVVPVFHPFCDAIALEAIRIVWNYLPKAYKEGRDINARGMMLVAAAMGATSFQKDLGAVHSMAHSLSTVCNIQHGLGNAICLKTVMNFNKEVCPEKYARIAQCLGINTYGMSDLEASDSAIDAIGKLNKNLGIPDTLEQVGVKEEQLILLAKKAFEDPCHPSNPRPCTETDLLTLYRGIY